MAQVGAGGSSDSTQLLVPFCLCLSVLVFLPSLSLLYATTLLGVVGVVAPSSRLAPVPPSSGSASLYSHGNPLNFICIFIICSFIMYSYYSYIHYMFLYYVLILFLRHPHYAFNPPSTLNPNLQPHTRSLSPRAGHIRGRADAQHVCILVLAVCV